MSEWNDHYAARQEFYGEPYPELIEYLDALPGRGLALDLGCGQGRDAVALSRLGFKVLGIDASPVGIAQLEAAGRQHGLDIEARVCTLEAFEPEGPYDLVLIDMVLHAAGSEVSRPDLLGRLVEEMATGGALVVVTPGRDEDAAWVRRLAETELIEDRPITHRFDGEDLTFHLTVVEKNPAR